MLLQRLICFLAVLLAQVTYISSDTPSFSGISNFKSTPVKSISSSSSSSSLAEKYRAGAKTGTEINDENDELTNEPYLPPGEDDEEATGGSANIQFMITNRMRYILENDLGYLPEEVDDMEPQIAAVVISRSLARPGKGMPDSWRRPDSSGSVTANPLKVFGNLIQSIQRGTANLGKSIRTGATAVGGLISSLGDGLSNGVQGIGKLGVPIAVAAGVVIVAIKIKESKISFKLPSLPSINLSIFKGRSKQENRLEQAKKKYNLKYLEKLHTPSFLDAVVVKAKSFGGKQV